MKIGVDIRVLMDEYYSGVSQYTANLLTAILAADKKNNYKLFYNSWDNFDKRLSIWRRDNASVIGSHIPNKIFNYLCQSVLSYPKIDKILGNVDIFWAPHFNFSSLGAKTKKILTVHDLSFLRYPEFFSFRKNCWHKALRVKNILRAADKIIAVSENTKNDIIELVGIAPEKIKVIYSGNNAIKKIVDIERADKFLQSHNISGRLILYLGTIEPRKNIIGLIAAYEALRTKNPELNDVKLLLVGAKGWKNNQTYSKWKKSPYKKDIIFLGYINEEERDILYAKSSVFAYPSFYEGFGFPPLEAMTYGLPVVCSNVSSLPEVVGAAAITVNPYESGEISDALRLVLTDQPLRELLIRRGYEQASKFTWERTASEYLDIFENI